MDDLECQVAAAQYPEGGLVLGMGAGIVIGMAFSPVLVAVAPILGALAGYGAGRVFRGYRLRRLRASAAERGESGDGEDTEGASADPGSAA
jgi:hypothetical protein